MSLTDRGIINLKAIGKQHKHFDGGGLHLIVYPKGGKAWRMTYRLPNAGRSLRGLPWCGVG